MVLPTTRFVRLLVGFEEPHLRLMVKFVEPKFSRISHISVYAAYQGGLVLRHGLERPVIIRT